MPILGLEKAMVSVDKRNRYDPDVVEHNGTRCLRQDLEHLVLPVRFAVETFIPVMQVLRTLPKSERLKIMQIGFHSVNWLQLCGFEALVDTTCTGKRPNNAPILDARLREEAAAMDIDQLLDGLSKAVTDQATYNLDAGDAKAH